ncbi:MAG: hypothetical protein C4291_04830 [Candidatus Dadabacteria bacterium]
MKWISIFTIAFAFAAVLLFGIRPNAIAQESAETVIGEVTSIDEGTIGIKEDSTQEEYQFRASPNKLKDISPGYRVEAKTANGRVLSLIILGMPTHAQVAPSQRFKVIKQGDRTINLKIEGTEGMSAPGNPTETAVAAIPNLSGTVVGQVISVDEGTITIKEDSSQTEYELRASADKLRDISPGYRIEAKAINGRVLSLTVLGMPMQVQPDPSQKFEVIVK